jgi:excisionase family DNA binding protein
MTNPETEMIFTPRWYTVAQVAQLLNYGESKVRMLIITGQLRSIKTGGPAGFFQSGLRPMFKIAPSQPRTSGDDSEPMARVRSSRTAMGSRLTFGSLLRQGSANASTSTDELVRSSTAGGWSSRGKPHAGLLSRRSQQLGRSSIDGSKTRLLRIWRR